MILDEYIKEYTEMDILGVRIHCPYWMNKILSGKVYMRGFLNGKGRAGEIRDEIIKRLEGLQPEDKFPLNPETLRKFAKRERIGIDCSGFVYQVLEVFFEQKRGMKLSEVFPGGINKTSARMIAGEEKCRRIGTAEEIVPGDMIRFWGGKHTAIVAEVSAGKIIYAHSSNLSTKIRGAHTAGIQIIDEKGGLEKQKWEEQTRTGENFGKRYFIPENGDAVYRLRIFG